MNTAEGGVSCRRVEPGDGEALADLFTRTGSGCFCRYWHFAGDKNEWLDRLAHAPERNREELLCDLREHSAELQGVIATLQGGPAQGVPPSYVVGWMKLTPTQRVAKLYDQRVYRALPCLTGDRDGVLAIGCFLVDPAQRRAGVARALVRAGVDIARQRGARAIEAFPRGGDGLGDEERWMGPLSAFVAEGFEVLHDFAPYPVLRRAL